MLCVRDDVKFFRKVCAYIKNNVCAYVCHFR